MRDRTGQAKRATIFSRKLVFLFSVLITGNVGGLMMIRNFCTKGNSKKIRLLILSVLVLQLIVWVILYYFSYVASYQWNLNKAIVGWDIADYIRWIPLVVKYFAVNVFIGMILIFPVWDKCIKYQLQNNRANL